MLKERTLKRMVQRTRRKVQNISAEQSNLQERVILQDYKQFEDGIGFLLYDYGPEIHGIYLALNVTLTFFVRVVAFFPMEHSAPPRVIFFNGFIQSTLFASVQ